MQKLVLLLNLILLLFIISCKKEQPGAEEKIGLRQIAEGFVSPVAIVEVPDGSRRLFVVDQEGIIWVLNANESKRTEPFLDISHKIVSHNSNYDERGLLSMAFHPQYLSNGRFYLYYSAPPRAGAPAGWNNTSRVSEFKVSASDPNIANPNSETIIMEIDQPQANHAGATLLFGPEDGYLYISLGDGGGANDVGLGHVDDWYPENEGGNAQNIEANFLGKILRIDVNSGSPYAIPPSNPFVGTTGLDEIYAFGLRNPYRMSFDKGGTQQLFCMDAGQHLWEEINIITKGGNYGWNVKEGTYCFNTANPKEPRASCPAADTAGNILIDPVIQLKNSDQPGGLGTVIVGGHVYRGLEVSQLNGKYIFGVWSKNAASTEGNVFEALPASSGMWDFKEVSFSDRNSLGHYLLGFGQTINGEIYLLTTNNRGPSGTSGKVYKIIAMK